MPQDLSKAAALKTSTAHPIRSTSKQQPSNDDKTTAISVSAQSTAGTIRSFAGDAKGLVDQAAAQRDMITSHAAKQVAQVWSRESMDAEFAAKLVQEIQQQNEGYTSPFVLPDVDSDLLGDWVTFDYSLPASLQPASASESEHPALPSSTSPIDAEPPETSGDLSAKKDLKRGFGNQDKD